MISPPALMDDVDAAEALQAKNMLLSGDWVTQQLNGTRYFDKAPLKYWITASLYGMFGIHDWVTRLPTAVAAILLCWLVVRMGRWADSAEVGYYSGLVLATSIGLFLFTRTVIPDVILTLFIALSVWCFLRALESETRSLAWAVGMSTAVGCAVLTKGLIGVVFPIAIGFIYLLMTGFQNWRRLHLIFAIILLLGITMPWHVLAIIQNPPVLDFTLYAGPHFGGKFRGFFWFYFINEQLLRFLNERWPRDYDTVPRFWFWLYHILWFFPWSFYLPAVVDLGFKPVDRAGRMRLLGLCWIGIVMLFFTLSTTQEYYSMPVYPAVALLIGYAMARQEKWMRIVPNITGVLCLTLAAVSTIILTQVWTMPTPGDIYAALVQHPDFYRLSLGHMADLTLPAFAYLRLPLAIAGVAFFAGGLAVLVLSRKRGYIAVALMLALFFQAARLALIVFDPYLSSHAVAQRLNTLPKGLLIVCGKYNPLSSVFFYSQDRTLQNDTDLDILEYGSLVPGAPKISVSDDEMRRLWNGPGRVYIVAKATKLGHLAEVLGQQSGSAAFHSGDKYLFVNQH